jgi:hypothetical protein
MDITDLLKVKLKNELLIELSEYDIEDLESQIDDKITDDLFSKEVREKQNDISDENRCCARSMGPRYSDVRCPYHRVKDDYCKIHLKQLDKYGYLKFKRFDESRPIINESGNKIPWRDGSSLEDINTVIQYQNMKLQKNIK